MQKNINQNLAIFLAFLLVAEIALCAVGIVFWKEGISQIKNLVIIFTVTAALIVLSLGAIAAFAMKIFKNYLQSDDLKIFLITSLAGVLFYIVFGVIVGIITYSLFTYQGLSGTAQAIFADPTKMTGEEIINSFANKANMLEIIEKMNLPLIIIISIGGALLLLIGFTWKKIKTGSLNPSQANQPNRNLANQPFANQVNPAFANGMTNNRFNPQATQTMNMPNGNGMPMQMPQQMMTSQPYQTQNMPLNQYGTQEMALNNYRPMMATQVMPQQIAYGNNLSSNVNLKEIMQAKKMWENGIISREEFKVIKDKILTGDDL